ncbi:diguanylate cyclase [Hahella sp. CR1]|uniref:GGDEF domain-containing response regulator n=1 Tax=Hahella sp. CR1 TaxID=2992807 RepID=UPI002441F854|nr:diguanylate cyclase [Hahella sp. CR1]MDG9667558.1 diguanylate cyclase [Hahella sp. CR1]
MALFSNVKLDAIKKRKEERPNDSGERHTVLVVDDEPANLKMLASLLADQYRLIEARSGAEALDRAQELPDPSSISLIISDQRMPGMSGVEFLEKIRLIIPDAVRIILTAYMDVGAILEAVNQAHIYQFIIKPFDRHDFLLTVKRATEHFDLRQELNGYVHKLEQKVTQRTQELERKNTELRQAYDKLEALSVTDPLTGLKNRRFIHSVLRQDSAFAARENLNLENRPVAPSEAKASEDVRSLRRDLLFYLIDIDHFKQVNDVYGHMAGDQLLRGFSQLLASLFRESDYLVRWGGEEFLVVSRFVSREQACFIAERIRREVEQATFEIGLDESVNKTCSIGFACYPFFTQRPGYLSWEQVADIADCALYAAKRSSRNSWVGVFSNNAEEPWSEISGKDWLSRFKAGPDDMLSRGEAKVISSSEAAGFQRWFGSDAR